MDLGFGRSGKSGVKVKQNEPHFDEIRGALYDERVLSFTSHNWPHRDPTRHFCTAEELAMAGFSYSEPKTGANNRYLRDRDPVGICFACDVQVVLHDFGPETDPWYLHAERSPDCPYIMLGKKKFDHEYKFGEIYDIIVKKQFKSQGLKLSNIQHAVKLGITNAQTLQDEAEK